MRLADLIDLEWRLHQDEEAVRSGRYEDVLRRDRAIGAQLLGELGVDPAEARARLGRDRAFRVAICDGWLAHRRLDDTEHPGERFEKGHRLVGWLLVAAGAVLGASSARAVLAYDGTAPVNVFWFVAVFFVLQIALLAALLLALLWRRPAARHGALGVAPAFVARLSRAAWVDRLLGERASALPAVLALLRRTHSGFRTIERWLLLATTQRFAVAFNVAALATCLYLVAFTDLAFGWSTTLELTPRTVHAWMHALAWPWAWLGDAAVPSEDLVGKTQWLRMQHSFAGDVAMADAVREAGRWWSFLLAGLVCWGLAPRLLALALAELRLRSTLRAVPLAHAGFQRLYERLVPPSGVWAGPSPDAVRGGDGAAPAVRDRAPLAAGMPTWVVCWGSLAGRLDLARAAVERRFDARVLGVLAAGGADLAQDIAARERLASERAAQAVVLVEAGAQPVKEIIAFLTAARRALAPEGNVVVGLVEVRDGALVDAERDELQQWRDRIDREADPYLRVESMVPA